MKRIVACCVFVLALSQIILSFFFIHGTGISCFVMPTYGMFVNIRPLAINAYGTTPFAVLPKIYVPPLLTKQVRFPKNKYIGDLFECGSGILEPVVDWFRVHTEYQAGEYMLHRALFDRLIFSDKLEGADLCFPSCDMTGNDGEQLKGAELDILVKRGSEAIFGGCKKITIGIETLRSQCSFPVPYWHSVYFNHIGRPWNLSTERKTLLCFIGGSWRGNNRAGIIDDMQTISVQRSNGTLKLFSVPLLFNSHKSEDGQWGTNQFFAGVWELYATSIFSWQPSGDSETRRGFYDSWMMGCIPVISRQSACWYKELLGGRLFVPPLSALEDVVIVLNDFEMRDGASILENLLIISDAEIRLRRQRMAHLGTLMQWGWDDRYEHPDALTGALMSLVY